MTVRVLLSPRRILRNILLLTAAGCLSYYGWSVADSEIRQTRESRVFDEARSETPTAGAKPHVSVTGRSTIGRISVPRLHLKAMVEEGDDDATLSHAVGHVPGTACRDRLETSPWRAIATAFFAASAISGAMTKSTSKRCMGLSATAWIN